MTEYFGRTAFLITKPLQLMVALSIVKQEIFENKPIFLMVDEFRGAYEVFENLCIEFQKLVDSKFFSSQKYAYKFILNHKINNIFIDSDVGFKKNITLGLLKFRSYKLNVYVYEEGLGTYRDDIYSGIKLKVFKALGIGVFFGGSIYVKGIYIFSPSEYASKFPENSHKIHAINNDLLNDLHSSLPSIKKLFGFDAILNESQQRSSCSVYLSDWCINHEFLEHFRSADEYLIIKLHPYIRENFDAAGMHVVDAKIPAELLLIELINKFNFIKVYDHDSSVRRYIKHHKVKYYLAEMKK